MPDPLTDFSPLLELDLFPNPDARCFRVRVKPGAEGALADALAVRIASALLDPSEEGFEAWLARSRGGSPLDAATKEAIEAYLMADFRPSKDPDQTRLLGAVVEHLWSVLAPNLDGAWGLPMHVEHDHFSVIDHGPDGVSLYTHDGQNLRFRLWESKRHTGSGSLTSVVTGAASQLKAHAAEYLARVSKPLQTHEDERVRLLAGRIVKLWTTRDDRSAVGVSVGRSSDEAVPARPFRGVVEAFQFNDVARCEGVVIEISDLISFGNDVRVALLRGID